MFSINTRLNPYASILIGAFFCLVVSSCNKGKEATADWHSATPEQIPDRPAQLPASSATEDSHTAEVRQEIRFLSYNLKNYLSMRRYIGGEVVDSPKPEVEIQALIEVIVGARPDVLGVCEIGQEKDLQDLQSRLKIAGINLPHSHRVQGADQVRALAILSRYPIVATAVPKKLNYTVNGADFKISRGILDTTIQLPARKVRFLGVHFKSKRPIREADQELMRRNESLLLRQHIDDILTSSPDTNIIAYGDFNDTKRTKSVYSIRGRNNSPRRMEIIAAKDSRGHNWTHHWKQEDIYSRFDFAMVNLNLAPHINKQGCKLLDPENWAQASDHRALLILIN